MIRPMFQYGDIRKTEVWNRCGSCMAYKDRAIYGPAELQTIGYRYGWKSKFTLLCLSLMSYLQENMFNNLGAGTGQDIQCFIMFSDITNIYIKKTKGPTSMKLFTATGKLIFFLTTRNIRCVHHGWHGTHRYDIEVLATHASTCWSVCGNNLNILSMCAVSPVVHTSNISSCQKKNQFSCGCEHFH